MRSTTKKIKMKDILRDFQSYMALWGLPKSGLRSQFGIYHQSCS